MFKNIVLKCLLVSINLFAINVLFSQVNSSLKVVIIRHGEKPDDGDNLSCAGLNRALLLPEVIHRRFGTPSHIYVPSPTLGKSTGRSRMFETIFPFAVKYNLSIDTKYDEKDAASIAEAILKQTGTVLVVWEHNKIPSLARKLGLKEASLNWSDDDYDSIWIITYPKGIATVKKDSERINPAKDCK